MPLTDAAIKAATPGREMMQNRAAYLDRLEAGSRAKVLPFAGGAA
jgi:hypothetical protein